MSNRKRRLGKRLISPDFMKAAKSLGTSGESGRAIPDVGERQMQRRVEAVVGEPAIPQSSGRLEIYTHFTTPGENLKLYEADSWVKLQLTLLDAGPVSVGTREQLSPVLSGKGGLLITGEEIILTVRKGSKVFITANTVNRVRVTIEPIAFGQQIMSITGSILTFLRKGR